jgi:hypothetical protein
MQIETRKISTWRRGELTPGLGRPVPRPVAPFIHLNPKRKGFDRPAFLPHIDLEDLIDHEGSIGQPPLQYFGKPYSFNTKYVVEIETDDIIGCHVSLSNGNKVWIDMDASVLAKECNRR